MQIYGLANSLLSLVGLGASSPASDSTRRSSPTALPSGREQSHVEPSDRATLRALAAQYDVHDITPRQFGMLLHELQAAGAMPASELADLAQLRLALDQAGLDPDDPLDLVAFVEWRLRDAELLLLDMPQQVGQSQLRRQLALLAKLEMLRSAEPLSSSA